MRTTLPLLAAALALVGCTAIQEARKAQDPDSRRDGERTVSAQEVGLGPGTTLSLDKGVSIVLRHNPAVAAARARVEQSKAVIEQIDAGYLPQISFSANYRWERSGGAGSGPVTGSRIGGSSITQSHAGAVTVSQFLYDFGKTDAVHRQAMANFVASQSDLASAENDAVYNFRQAFFDLLKQEELVRVGEETVRQFEKRLEQVKGFVEVGTRQKYDLTKAQVDLGNAQLSLVKARTALVVARANLNNTLGLAADPVYTVEHPGVVSTWTMAFDDAAASARSYHPELQALLLRENAARAAIDASIAEFYPQLNLNASFSWSGSLTPIDWFAFIGPTLNWVLFSGWEKTGALHETVAALHEAYANRAREEQALFLELRQAYAVLEDTTESRKIASLTVKQAEENLDLASGRYQAGKASSVELTDAQVALANARAAEIQSRYDFEIAVAAIQRSIGGSRKP